MTRNSSAGSPQPVRPSHDDGQRVPDLRVSLRTVAREKVVSTLTIQLVVLTGCRRACNI